MEFINTEQPNPSTPTPGVDASASPPPMVMDPWLLMAASTGDCEALKNLLNWGDAPVPPVAVALAPQVVVEVPSELYVTNGSFDSEQVMDTPGNATDGGLLMPQASTDAIEEDAAALSTADSLLEGVTPLGDTALHVAAKSGSSAKNFLDSIYVIYGKAKHILDKPNKKGNTPLHCAARAGCCDMVSYLVDLAKSEEGGIERAKAVLHKLNVHGETALHEAIRASSKAMIRLLLTVDSELARVPSEGTSPLYLAILLRQYDTAVELHQKDEYLSYSGPDGLNALHIATCRSPDMTATLLAWNKDLTKEPDHNGCTPLHVAAYKGFNIAFGLLLEANLSAVYQADKNGSFPIHIASSEGKLKVVITLLDKCPECVNLCDGLGRTFLHVAVEKKMYNIVSYACGTPLVAPILNTQDNAGNTALHLAVQIGDLRMFCSLVANLQLRLTLPNYGGRTPRDIAWGGSPDGLVFYWSPQVLIYEALLHSGAKYGHHGVNILHEEYTPKHENALDAEKLKDSTQVLGIGAVLIATVAFGATFALPGGYRADDHPDGGTPTLAGRYAFNAYIMATTLAFVCASVGTVCLMFSGMTMVDFAVRRKYFDISVLVLSSSVTSLGASFSLGLYLVLAPVAYSTAIAVFVCTCAITLMVTIEQFQSLKIARAIHARVGKRIFRILVEIIVKLIITAFWPLIIIFGWAACSTKYRHK